MPPLIAPLFALAAAFAVLGDAPAGWLVALAAGALAPDVDLLLLLVSPASAVRLHRGPTHTPIGLLATGAGAGLVVHATGGPALAPAIGFALAGAAVHAAFDALSIQGLARWSGRAGSAKRAGKPVLVASDPILTALFALGVLGAAAFPAAARVAGGAATLLGLYLVALRFVFARRAAAAAREALSTPVEGVFPRPESPARWTVVTRTVDGIRAGVLDLGTRRLSMLEHAPEIDAATAAASPLGQALLDRALFPVAREAPRAGQRPGKLLHVRDLRFAFDWPAPPFGADLELDADGRPLRERAYL